MHYECFPHLRKARCVSPTHIFRIKVVDLHDDVSKYAVKKLKSLTRVGK
jgi:hypothetical protein